MTAAESASRQLMPSVSFARIVISSDYASMLLVLQDLRLHAVQRAPRRQVLRVQFQDLAELNGGLGQTALRVEVDAGLVEALDLLRRAPRHGSGLLGLGRRVARLALDQ